MRRILQDELSSLWQDFETRIEDGEFRIDDVELESYAKALIDTIAESKKIENEFKNV